MPSSGTVVAGTFTVSGTLNFAVNDTVGTSPAIGSAIRIGEATTNMTVTATGRVFVSRGTAGVDPTLGRGPLISFAMGPNPARLETSLRFSLRQPLRAGFRLLDVQGREVWSSPEQAYEAGDHVVGCSLGEVRPGLYFLRFEHGGEAQLTRLAVVR